MIDRGLEFDIKFKVRIYIGNGDELIKDFRIIIKAPQGHFAKMMAALSNKAPYLLKPHPPKEFDIDMIYNEDGELQDDSQIIVKSNKAVDPEGGPVKMEFSNGGKGFIRFK